MDFKKANLEICRSIADDKNICGGWIQIGGIKYFFVANAQGYYGYFFPRNKIVFNVAMINSVSKPIKEIVKMSIVNRENEVFYTKILKQCSAYRNKLVRKFVPLTGNREVYIDVNFLKCLDLDICHFYQDKDDPKSKLIVTEHDMPIMVICPMMYTEGD